MEQRNNKPVIIGSVIVIVIAVALVFLTRYVLGMGLVPSIIITIVAVFVIYFIVMFVMGRMISKSVRSIDAPFFREQNEIVRTYAGQYEKIYEALMNMTEEPKTEYAEGLFHVNVADALIGMGRDEEALDELDKITGNFVDVNSSADLLRDDIEDRKYERVRREEEEREAAIEAAARAERRRLAEERGEEYVEDEDEE